MQRSGDKTSSGKIGLDIRTHASPKVGQDQMSGGVSVPLSACHTRCRCSMETNIWSNVRFSVNVKSGYNVKNWYNV